MNRLFLKMWLAAFLIGAAPGGKLLGAANDYSLHLARQNPILRNYFQEFLSGSGFSLTFRHPERPYSQNRQRDERRIDHQIDHFLKQLREKLDQLKASVSEAKERGQLMLSPGSDNQWRQQRVLWKKSLKEVADRANDLRTMLSFVLVSFKKADFDPNPQPDQSNPGFQKELQFIEDQLKHAERQIGNYFFTPNHIVDVDELRGNNLLIDLYRIRQMSRKLSEAI